MSFYSKITGLGSYVPEKVWTNNDLCKLMDTSDEWIQQRTGIQQRHWVDQDSLISATDLGLIAAQRAIENSGIKKEQLDMILFATLSPDHEFPGSACFFQAKLDVPGIPAIDIRQQCSGFLYSMTIADQFIRTGMCKNVLVVGAEVHSRALDKTTRGRDISVLFGDGAGAVVMSSQKGAPQKSDSQFIVGKLHADGKYAKELWLPGPGLAQAKNRVNLEMLEAGDQYPRMNGKTVFIHASKRMPEALVEALEASHYQLSDVDLFIFHQANLRINEMVAKQLGIPEEKVFNTIQKFGNTTAATIPLGLDEAVKAGKLKKGMLVASAAFGSGFTWASALYRW